MFGPCPSVVLQARDASTTSRGPRYPSRTHQAGVEPRGERVEGPGPVTPPQAWDSVGRDPDEFADGFSRLVELGDEPVERLVGQDHIPMLADLTGVAFAVTVSSTKALTVVSSRSAACRIKASCSGLTLTSRRCRRERAAAGVHAPIVACPDDVRTWSWKHLIRLRRSLLGILRLASSRARGSSFRDSGWQPTWQPSRSTANDRSRQGRRKSPGRRRDHALRLQAPDYGSEGWGFESL